MSVLDTIQSALGGDIATGIAKIISLFKVDPNIALQKQTEIEEIQLGMVRDAAAQVAAQLQGQLEINKAEAASSDKFTSRARPTIMYICAVAMGSNFIVSPFATWIGQLCGKNVSYPTLDMSVMMPVLLGILGLTAGHVFENTQSSPKK